MLQEQDTSETTDFRFPGSVPRVAPPAWGLRQRLEAVCRVAEVISDVRQPKCKSMGRNAAPVARQAAIPWRTWANPSSPWPCIASAQPRKLVPVARPEWEALLRREHDSGLCVLINGLAHLCAPERPRPPKIVQTPDYRDAIARAPMSGPRGCGPGLASGTPATRGSSRYRFGRPHPDHGPCGMPAYGAGLACSAQGFPLCVGTHRQRAKPQ